MLKSFISSDVLFNKRKTFQTKKSSKNKCSNFELKIFQNHDTVYFAWNTMGGFCSSFCYLTRKFDKLPLSGQFIRFFSSYFVCKTFCVFTLCFVWVNLAVIIACFRLSNFIFGLDCQFEKIYNFWEKKYYFILLLNTYIENLSIMNFSTSKTNKSNLFLKQKRSIYYYEILLKILIIR